MQRRKIRRHMLQPIRRSKVRLQAGKLYYTLRRYGLWYFGKLKFAVHRSEKFLSYLYFSHRTPLLRELKDVETIYHHNKIINLKIATQRLNGVIIKPRETFSYWRLIGKPTAAKGYVPGMVLFCGNYHMAMGGGLCQLSNLIYWMSLHTPLTVLERYRHSYDVFPDSNRTQPFGSGATCVYPYRDLILRNDTNSDFQLRVAVGESWLQGAWLSSDPPMFQYEVIEKNHLYKGEYWGGYSRHNELYRNKYTLSGEWIEEEYITENHALMMYAPFLSEGAERTAGTL